MISSHGSMIPKCTQKAKSPKKHLKKELEKKTSGDNPSKEDILFRALKSSELTIHIERERFLAEIASEHERREEAYRMLEEHRQVIELERKAKKDAYRMQEERRQLLESEMKVKLEERRSKEEVLRALFEKEKHLSHILQSRSWRYTLCFRKAEALLRNALHLKGKHTQEEDMEEEEEDEGGGGPPIPAIPGLDLASDVAVIITCHNYGQYLADAIESVLRQTYRPRELVIVDDTSTDDTPQVANAYKQHGVQHIYCDQGHPSSARNEGVRHTSAPFLLFLDADDILVSDYISSCMEKMKDPSVAIAYARLQHFGKEICVLEPPEFDREALFKSNYISSHALIRKQAFDMVGGYRKYPDSIEDWDLYRRILQFPWKAAKAETTIYYRIHGKNRSRNHPEEYSQFWKSANILQCPITIFTPFAGRGKTFDAYLQGLKSLDFDPELIRLHWFDTSGDEAFGQMLRRAISTLPFGRSTYSHAPLPKLWNFTPDRLIQKQLSDNKAQYYYEMAVVYAYNTLITSCDTEFSLTLEDDIVISPSALTNMIKTVAKSNTVAVIAPYPCHIQGHQLVWKNNSLGKAHFFQNRRTGIEKVDGGGFGCSLFRMSTLSTMPIHTRVYENPSRWYNHIAFAHLRKQGEVLCNWDVEVEHLETNRFKGKKPQDLTTLKFSNNEIAELSKQLI